MATYYVSTTGSDTTGDGSEGNPWASPGYASGQIASDDEIIIDEGTYSITVNTDNVAGGKVAPTVSCRIVGVNAPVLLVTSGITGMIVRSTTSNARFEFRGLVVDGDNLNVTGISTANDTNSLAAECMAIRCNLGFRGTIYRCLAVNCVAGYGAGNAVGDYFMCVADGCDIGFDRPSTVHGCRAIGCGFGFSNTSSNALLVGSDLLAYDCDTGFRNTSNRRTLLSGVLAASCTTSFNIGVGVTIIHNVAIWDSGGTHPDGVIDLAADPFENASTRNFNLNDVEGGGALLRNVNFPMPGLASTDIYPFRQWVTDSFGDGSGTAGYTGIVAPRNRTLGT